MSDYGIASNENDTISIEEEITQLGLKYNLVTEYTSFVAVDSCAVTSNNEGNSDPGSGGGTTVDVNELSSFSNSEKNILKILGTISNSEGILKLELENFENLDLSELRFQITNISGQIISIYDEINLEYGNTASIPLGQLSTGVYFISIGTKSKILDTERFIIIP